MNHNQALKEILSRQQSIVITTHQRPDGDAIGSSLALYRYLKAKGHQVTVISPTDYPEFLKWMPGNEQVLIYENTVARSTELIGKATLIFCLDFNKLYRLEELGKIIESAKAPKVLIDHHLEPDGFAEHIFWNTSACSTSELVYRFIMDQNDAHYMDEEVATCLYAGVLTDTDRFRIPATNSQVHLVVADLLSRNVNHTRVYELIYETFTVNRLRLIGACLSEKLELFPELKTGIIALDKQDFTKFQIQPGDTEGLVNYALWISEIELSILLIPRNNECKLSFRSKGDLDVNEFARKNFNGGGHKNASGGVSSLSIADTRLKLISILAALKKN
jgi:phosphoesterase RecJ-like protein